MHTMFSHVWRIVAFWAVALTTVALAETLNCQTSEGSPSSSECSILLNTIKNHPESINNGVPDCVATNSKGSGCKDVFWYAHCSISVCRQDGTLDLTINKDTVITGAGVLLDRCTSNGRVGGIIGYDSMGQQNNGTSCYPKKSNAVDEPINVEIIKKG
ncbi:hypothetical protein GGR53DRAFT_466108 [Hypoxylon sp. FL1150]|nr:hypothetical protein GGR53DRAFT_466108 [Hypoxylon sp. FL1150]